MCCFQGSDRYVLHKQDAVSKSAGAAIDGIKKSRAVKTKKQDELAQVASLSGDALQALQSLALTCIEAFNGEHEVTKISSLQIAQANTLFFSVLPFYMEGYPDGSK